MFRAYNTSGQYIVDHGPRPRDPAPVSITGLALLRDRHPGSEGMVPEAGAWAGVASKTPIGNHNVIDLEIN